jgi:hypothetical protein
MSRSADIADEMIAVKEAMKTYEATLPKRQPAEYRELRQKIEYLFESAIQGHFDSVEQALSFRTY